MVNHDTITMADNRTFTVGQRVEITTGGGGEGNGEIVRISSSRWSAIHFHVKPDADFKYGQNDRWPLAAGGFFNRPLDHGVTGGGIVRVLRGAS